MTKIRIALVVEYGGGVYNHDPRRYQVKFSSPTLNKSFGLAEYAEEPESDRRGITKRVYISGQPVTMRKYLALSGSTRIESELGFLNHAIMPFQR
jgi:hypothetical protein